MMRQAGRHLPEYMKLREDYSFHDLVKNPELACEVTMQPVRRYGLDAAITFSDILVIPEALGQPYGFRDRGGIEMEFKLESEADIDRLDVSAVREHLEYVPAAQRAIRAELGEDRAMLGFAGAPWTLATYMVEGGSSRDYRLAKQMYYERPDLFEKLMTKLVDAVSEYLLMQVDAGVDAVQIFDSWGGVLSAIDLGPASLKWITQIVERLGDIPVIVFVKHGMLHADQIAATGATVIGVDWTADIAAVRKATGKAVQGNLDPIVIETTPEVTRRETRRILDAMSGLNGHIFNLGHGISPHGRIDCVEAMIDEIRT